MKIIHRVRPIKMSLKNFNKIFSLILLLLFICIFIPSISNADPQKFENKFKIDTEAGKLSFLSADGTAFKDYEIQKYIPGKQSPSRVSISDNGNFICVTTVAKENQESEGDANSIILDDKGNELWKVNTIFPFAAVSPNGKYIICRGADDPGEIYYRDGDVVKLKDVLLSGSQYSYAGLSQYSFSKDGSFAVGIIVLSDLAELRKRTDNLDGGYITDLLAVDETGRILWRKNDFPEGLRWVSSVKVLENDNVQVTLFNSRDKTKLFRLYSLDGNLISKSN